MRHLCLLSFCLLVVLAAADARADDFVLTIKDHSFSPAILDIPADQKIKLVVKNMDSTPAEFESSDLDREKVVGPMSEITVFIGPLDKGTYSYFDDFHRDTTTGSIRAQ